MRLPLRDETIPLKRTHPLLMTNSFVREQCHCDIMGEEGGRLRGDIAEYIHMNTVSLEGGVQGRRRYRWFTNVN